MARRCGCIISGIVNDELNIIEMCKHHQTIECAILLYAKDCLEQGLCGLVNGEDEEIEILVESEKQRFIDANVTLRWKIYQQSIDASGFVNKK
jgi:hypothetical protein